MQCAWNELLKILPVSIRQEVDRIGKESLQELRLRVGARPELVLSGDRRWLPADVDQKDLDFVINASTKYSPWTAQSTAEGYITATGGHRIGLCGDVVCKDGHMTGIRKIRSLCIRVARDFPGIGQVAAICNTSILILGPPGAGKTTLLRDVIRQIGKRKHISVVDERCELFPEGFEQGLLQDTLTGCSKKQGIEILLKTMGPEVIAVDEITTEEDCKALIRAAHCGVFLIATAHAGCLEDLYQRRIYHTLLQEKFFRTVLVLKPDKSFTMERVEL